MSPSTIKLSVPTESITILDIVPPTPPTSPYITQYELKNTVKYIHTSIKYLNENINTAIKAINNNITAMLAKIIDKTYKQDKQDEKTTELSSKL